MHSSKHSSKINKLLPTPSIDNNTANSHPTMINLHTLAHYPLLPSLTPHLCMVLASQQQEFHQDTSYQLYSNTMHFYLPRSLMVMTQICSLPTSFLDIYLQLICSLTTIALTSQWQQYQQLSNSTMLPKQQILPPP